MNKGYISNPNQQRIRDLFDYLPSGHLYRKRNKKITGKKLNALGYSYTKMDGYTVPVHRLIYIYHYGTIPEGYHIDHIDHDRSNNCIENLRAVPARENLGKHKRSKHPDVYKTKDAKRWVATKRIVLGVYDTEEEAIEAINSSNRPARRVHGIDAENDGKI